VYVSPTPAPDKTKYLNSVTSGESGYSGIGEEVKKGIVDGVTWLVTSLFNVVSPFITWGCKMVIVSCIIIYFCDKEERHIGTAIKFAIIFVLFCTIRSVLP